LFVVDVVVVLIVVVEVVVVLIVVVDVVEESVGGPRGRGVRTEGPVWGHGMDRCGSQELVEL